MEMDFMGLNPKEEAVEADHMTSFYTDKSSQSEGVLNERNFAVNKTSEFYTNMRFKSRQELMEWVQNIARSLGYVIVTKRSKRKPNGITSKITLMCDRSGIHKTNKRNIRSSCSKKTNCLFKLVGKYYKRGDFWTLSVMCNEHNHEPAPHMEGHPYAMRLSDNEIRLVQTLTKNDVNPQDILAALKERNTNNVSTLRTIYNARQKLRRTANAGSEDLNNRNSDENQKNMDHSSLSGTHVSTNVCSAPSATNHLTISYGDTTKVYNDLSPEKAKAIMLLVENEATAKNTTIVTPVFGGSLSGSSSTVDINEPKGMDFLRQLMQSEFASTPYVLGNRLWNS